MNPKASTLGALGLTILAGCGASMPVQRTGNANEYVISRSDKGPLGSLSGVKAAATAEATGFCTSLKKNGKFKEKHSIDKERAVFVWPETTLYFECTEDGAAHATGQTDAKPSPEPLRARTAYDELLKLDELRKKGVITEAEFESEKKKLLNTK